MFLIYPIFMFIIFMFIIFILSIAVTVQNVLYNNNNLFIRCVFTIILAMHLQILFSIISTLYLYYNLYIALNNI